MDTRGMKQEYFARAVLVTGVVSLVLAIILYFNNQPTSIVLKGRMSEQGGWQPGSISAQVGVPLELRLTSEDVVHGFAVGQMDSPEVEVLPGKYSELEITFEKAGTYTYYCTRWCGPNHWRMRGTIEVEGVLPNQDAIENVPLYIQLGIDIDDHHETLVVPTEKPSAIRGKSLESFLPEKYLEPYFYFSNTPTEIFEGLIIDETLINYQDEQIWDMVAYLYYKNTSKEKLEEGQQLYSANCAACHGLSGLGDGVFAESEEYLSTPVDFSKAEHMLSASPALLQGKIIRGGMGTGMPYWGTIFTEEQIWSLVSYLWSFQFEFSMDKE
jgi:plastocyanin